MMLKNMFKQPLMISASASLTIVVTSLTSNSALANAQKVVEASNFYVTQQSFSDSVVYAKDGEPLNWYPDSKVKETSAPQCSEEELKGSISKKCFKLNVANLLNDKKWTKNKNLREVGTVVTDIENQIRTIGDGKTPYQSGSDAGAIPAKFTPWWATKVSSSLSGSQSAVTEDINSLIERAIVHSTQIKVFSDVPIIRETAIYEAKGQFDPVGYFDYRWTDIDDPVGSTLTTGGEGRFLENERLSRLGIRKKFVTGTEVDIFKQWGVLDNNSEFLVPNDQASTRWSITLSQPLLNGFGVKYNRSNIDVAAIDSDIALDEYKRQIESHLLELVRAYWGLYLERGALIQKRKLVESAQQMVDKIGQRGSFDATRAQMSRVKSRLLERKSDMVRAESAVRNAEAKVIALINDPDLRISPDFELIPSMQPMTNSIDTSADLAVALAMSNRPEVAQTFKQVKAGALRVDVSRSELKPNLDFIATYYRDGIAGDGDTSLASDNALDEGDGSWVVGLVFEHRIGNTAKKAALRRKKAELRQLINQLRTTLETVVLEVQVSVREVNTSLRKMNAQYAILQSSELSLQSLEKRQKVDFGQGQSGVAYLESLLQAQDDLTIAEYEFLGSQVSYNIALTNLDRATGMLLQTSKVQPRRYENVDENYKKLPTYKVEKVRLKN